MSQPCPSPVSRVLRVFVWLCVGLIGVLLVAGVSLRWDRIHSLHDPRWQSALTLVGLAVGGWLAIDLMTSQQELRELARAYLPWLVVGPLVGCWAYLYDGIFVGATLNRQMRDTMLFAALVVYLPAWWLLRPLGNHGLWLAFTLFLAGRGAAQWWVLRRLRHRGGLLPA